MRPQSEKGRELISFYLGRLWESKFNTNTSVLECGIVQYKRICSCKICNVAAQLYQCQQCGQRYCVIHYISHYLYFTKTFQQICSCTGKIIEISNTAAVSPFLQNWQIIGRHLIHHKIEINNSYFPTSKNMRNVLYIIKAANITELSTC